MSRFPTEKIRNVALIGHQGAGKTSLAEALLFRAGVRNRLGRIEDGTTACDFDPEEQERGISMSLAVAPLEWKGYKINVIDTPGYADFAGDVTAGLRVADLAVFVVSAVEGVEVQTEQYWREAEALGVPRMVFVNKLDRERADLDRVLGQLHDDFGAGFAPLELPIGVEAEFHGVADVLTEKAYLYDSGQAELDEIPADLFDHEHEVHDAVVEGIVVADDELLEHYLEGEVPDFETLEHALAHSVAECHAFPVLCGAATKAIGVERLADFICELGPTPAERPPVVEAAGDAVEVPVDADGPAVAFVFKTVADQYVGRISLFRVLSGTIKRDDHLRNTRSGKDERIHEIFLLRGKEHLDTDHFTAGDIGAVAKLHDTATGDTLAVAGHPVQADPIHQPPPVLAMAIVARTQPDEDKLANALHRLVEEDPALIVEQNPETHQTVLRGTGETHLQLTIERLERKFGVHVDTEEVQVAYRETVTAAADAEGRHKKQSGGHGQFGVCSIRMEPLERGSGFEFVDKITGGAISRGYIPAVRAGVEEAMRKGGVFGYPVVDVSVMLVDGKEHSVDSSEMAFRAAGRLAFREAMAKAAPVLLEPVSRVEITVPPDLQGDVIADLNSRRGSIQGSELRSPLEQVIVADVPEAEMRRYAIQLRSITSGRGRFAATRERYDVVPAHLVEKIRREVDHDE